MLSRPTALTLLAGAVLWAFVAVASSLNKSPTLDEVPHFGGGYAIVEHGDYRMNPEHPPLVKALAYLPVHFLCRPQPPPQAAGMVLQSLWDSSAEQTYGYYLLFLSGRPPRTLILLARIVPILIGLAGGWFAFLWGRELSRHSVGGVLAAFFLLFYPEYLGHARFVTYDVPTLASCAAISWSAYCWLRRRSWKSAAGFLLSVAIGSTVKLPVTVFVVFTLGTLTVLAARRSRRDLVAAVTLSACTAGVIVLAMWASAGFRFSFSSGPAPDSARGLYIPPHGATAKAGSAAPEAVLVPGIRSTFVDFAWKHRLLPESVLATMRTPDALAGRTMFLMGESSNRGWLHYFLVTIATKTSVFMLLGIAASVLVGALSLVKRRHSFALGRRIERTMLLAAPFILLFLLYAAARPNNGHRQILFVYFPMCVVLGAQAGRWLQLGRAPRLIAAGLVLVQAANCAFCFPHFETYFNELIRTPYRGARILRDSNVDWGQDVPLLANYMRRQGWSNLNYAVFSSVRPEAYGITKYRTVIPKSTPAMDAPAVLPVDPGLPTAVSLNLWLRDELPPPDIKLNSILIYLPSQAAEPPRVFPGPSAP